MAPAWADIGRTCNALSLGIPGAFPLRRIPVGNDQIPSRFDAIKTLSMPDSHQRLAVTMTAKHGGSVWSDEVQRCRSLPQ
jgi:hypothetical protein